MTTEPKKSNVINFDDMFEPIELVLDGKQYSIDKITQTMVQDVVTISSSLEGVEGVEDVNAKGDVAGIFEKLRSMMAIFVGCQPSEFVDTDIRKLSRAVKMLNERVQSEMRPEDSKAKN